MSTVPTSGPMKRVDVDGMSVDVRTTVSKQSAVATRPGAAVHESKAFYELDRWSKYNDPLLVVSFLLVVVSVAFMWPPYTICTAGTLLGLGGMKLAWMMGKGKA